MSIKTNIDSFIMNMKVKSQQREEQRILDRIIKVGEHGLRRIASTNPSDNVPAIVKDAFDPTKSQIARPNFIGNNRRITVFNGIFVNSWNLLDIYHAYTVESYLKFAVDTYVEGALRNGYHFASKNDAVVDYIKMRHREFEILTGITLEEQLRAMIWSTILYGNTFLSKYRSEANSSGRTYVRFDGKKMMPIAGLYVEDARRITIEKESEDSRFKYVRSPLFNSGHRYLNANNPGHLFFEGSQPTSIVGAMAAVYRAYSSAYDTSKNEAVTIKQDDMVHIRYHATPGEKWAMPPFYPAIPDIETLRKLEENVELLMFQYGHPLIHVKVGDDKKKGTQPEINDVTAKMNAMESNGFLVTDNRVEMEAVGAEGKAIRASEYLSYFKSRAWTGLWLTPVSTGEGGSANRATADIIDKTKQDKTIEIQSIISDAYRSVLVELLLEAGADLSWILNSENEPSLVFHEVDTAAKVLKENHIVNQYVQGVLSRDEARREIGRKAMTPDEDADTYAAHASKYNIQLALAKASVGPTGSSGNAVQPANQNGRKIGPTRTKNS